METTTALQVEIYTAETLSTVCTLYCCADQENNTRAGQNWHSLLPREGNIIAGSYLIAIGVPAFFLNIVILYRHLKHWYSLSSLDRFMASMAANDIIMLFTFPVGITSFYYRCWIFGETVCVIYGFVGFFTGLSKICALTGIAILRCTRVCSTVPTPRTESTTKVVAVSGFVYTFVWSVLPLVGFGKYGPEPNPVGCSFDWLSPDMLTRAFIGCIVFMCAVLPFIIVSICYLRIWRTTKQSALKPNRTTYLLKMWALMSLAFLVAWLPYAAVSVVSLLGYGEQLPMVLHTAPVLFAKASVLFDPGIYFLCSQRFRSMNKSVSGGTSLAGTGQQLSSCRKPGDSCISPKDNSRSKLLATQKSADV